MMNSDIPQRIANTPLIKLRKVTKVFDNNSQPVEVVRNLSFHIHKGEHVTIIGPSGCGKSTILNLIAGFIGCTSGEIIVDGENISGPSPNRTVIFQDHNLFPWKTVKQNIEFGLKSKGMKKHEREPIVRQYIDFVRLTGFENKYPFQLSGGMKQRVAIARAFIIKPLCILMDEPFGSLDAYLKENLQMELLKFKIANDITILFVTHDIEEAIFLSDRVIVLSPRPGEIRDVMPIHLCAKRKPDIKLDKVFMKLKNEIYNVLF